MIFVNIASYRDPECERTVRNIFRRAKRPDQIRVVIISQEAPEDNLKFEHDRVEFIYVNWWESQGVCWARAKGYNLWNGEDYVLQIDSHMRFAEGWDDNMLNQLATCQAAKPMLTTYGCAYDEHDHFCSSEPLFLAAKSFEPNGFLYFCEVSVHPRPSTPKPTAFVSAHFIFARAEWIQEVPYDPWLYFAGEEPTLAVRLWTSGWDLFGPTEPLIAHRSERRGRHLHWDDVAESKRMNERSLKRMRHLLGIEEAPGEAVVSLREYDLGKFRTLQDYERFSGVNFGQRTIAPHALAGEFGTTIW
jgi:glycosyltransferase involved in cell wall biosynthesis